MYLVIGATGNVGAELVKQLLDMGQDVRALVRDASRAELLPEGASFAVGDLEDPASLTAAAHGVDAVFFMQLAPIPAQAQAFIDSVRTAGVRRVVVLSSVGTRLHPAPTIGAFIAARDDVFRASDLDVTYIYANGLMSNAQWWAPTIRESGQVIDATEPGKIGVVDPHDVAAVAVIALTEPGHVGHGYFVTGPEALSPSELTSILSDVLGRDLEFVASTPEEEARRSIERGTAPQMAAARQNLDELFALSRAGIITDDVHNLTGNAPRSFRTWAQNHAATFA
jgi:uncharacterized protein YbjT (DUF2867 family)